MTDGDRTDARPPRRRGRRRATRPADGGVPTSGTALDDTDRGWGERPDGAGGSQDGDGRNGDSGDERLRADRPPHHDQGW